ncbi:bacilysin biosynthesis oxidoreductase BacG [Bacillus thuringiensis]|uniref:Bacilysin biosynthesis oxidoreductase BacG n=1 Tax=Bacillus thuringiensis TaxID=1428 RepID=A0A4R4B2A1_BACTU|nr:SDR family oxidoreductase [Bacillus thuringiensis]TCW47566.1 bacilysin biosynthesis oxidoreductase BacG [Bacillus thuringiensis]TCW47722.1 bacilysin biosynthesis oxidoreductase BacG [Bacillus thuringiensis]
MENRKVALVIGGSQGIGRAVAINLVNKGYQVVVNSRNSINIELMVEELKSVNPSNTYMGFVGDITLEKSRKQLFKDISEKFGRLDILINNVPGGKPDSFLNSKNEEIVQAFSNKAITYIDCIRRASEIMRERQYGRIVNIVGNLWKEPTSNMFTNGLINAAIINASKNISTAVAPEGITVNCINPGFIFTDRYTKYIESIVQNKGISEEKAKQEVLRNIPVNRVGLPEEISSLITYLVSEDASYVTGQQISVDGGSIRSI